MLLLKRIVIGVDELWKCGALERAFASAVGVNVPLSICPLACACVCEQDARIFGRVTYLGDNLVGAQKLHGTWQGASQPWR